jgi:LPXTG-site transpeptidase (sortase) family protein
MQPNEPNQPNHQTSDPYYGSLNQPAPMPATDPSVQAARDKLAYSPPPAHNPLAVTLSPAGAGIPQPVSPAAQYRAAHKPPRRRTPSRWRPFAAGIAMFIFLVLFFKSGVLLSQLHYFTAKSDTNQVVTPVAPVETVGPESIITIPKINVSAPVIYEPSIEEPKIQKALQNGVVHYGTSALPGQPGNSVIVGHSSNDWWEPGNYKFVFVLLDKLAAGDTITVNHNSRKYTYTVTEVSVVEPTNVSVLAPTPEPTLTLITCTPPGTSWKRLIIRAKQTSPAPSATIADKTPTRTAAEPSNKLPSDAPSFSQQLKGIWTTIVDAFTGGDEQPAAPTPSTQPSTQTLPRAL